MCKSNYFFQISDYTKVMGSPIQTPDEDFEHRKFKMNCYWELHFKHCEKMCACPKKAVERDFRYNNMKDLKVNISGMDFFLSLWGEK